jgi:hypothetical protein
MIRIACTSCKAILTVDDAFAGGVCRCQHCGTIQVVPAHLKPAPKAPAPAAKAAASTPVASIAGAAAAATASLPQKTAPPAKSAAHVNGNLLKLGVIIAFILFLMLIAVILIFLREA